METHNLIFHSRPRAEADWDCPRKRYYAYDFEGGIVKDNLTLELFIGTAVHDGLAAIATHYLVSKSVDIDQIATACRDLVFTTLYEYAGDVPEDSAEKVQAHEQATLVEGLLRGFYKQSWPLLIKEYPEVVAIEKECIYPHDAAGKLNLKGPYVFMAKPDLILRGPNGLVYIEYKTTSSKKVEWIQSWQYAIQVHATMKAIEFTLGEAPACTIVQGLYKGYSQYGKFSSNLVYAYEKKGNPPFTQHQLSAEYKPGFRKAPIWEIEGSIGAWLDKIPAETLAEQFPQTPMIFLNDDMQLSFFRQRAIREETVQSVGMWSPEELDIYFPQSFSKCRPAWGHECNYLKLCHGSPSTKADPIGSGLFMKKDRAHEEPFHELAEELLK